MIGEIGGYQMFSNPRLQPYLRWRGRGCVHRRRPWLRRQSCQLVGQPRHSDTGLAGQQQAGRPN